MTNKHHSRDDAEVCQHCADKLGNPWVVFFAFVAMLVILTSFFAEILR